MSWHHLQWHQLSVIFRHHLQTSTVIQGYVSISLSMWGNLDFPVGTIFLQLTSSFERKGTEARFDSSCISPKNWQGHHCWCVHSNYSVHVVNFVHDGQHLPTKIGKVTTVVCCLNALIPSSLSLQQQRIVPSSRGDSSSLTEDYTVHVDNFVHESCKIISMSNTQTHKLTEIS